ncbi:MAG: hypothetical protein JOZ80_08735 [Acidobacteriaceae bacterium]|nr:hypothetical protein [Acidobacteriaceae bacterium]
MRIRSFLLWPVLLLLPTIYALSQQSTANSAAVHMVVTVEAKHGNTPPELTQQDVMVSEGKVRDQVTDWIPAKNDHAALDFFLLIDDGASLALGSQLEDIRQFILNQPPTTRVGVAYMQNGVAQVVQNLTSDHAQAAKTVRLPQSVLGADSSPYFSLQDLIKRWPQSTVRREVCMISDGVDWFGGTSSNDPYVSSAIEDAQKAGVIVYDIYMPGSGHEAHSYWRWYWGQYYLSQLADETGGESYYIGFQGAPVSFAPYFDSINHRLGNQYFLGFLPKPEKKAGLRRVRLQTEVPNAELVSSPQVYVPASPE